MTFNSKKNSHIFKMRDLNLPKYCNLDALANINDKLSEKVAIAKYIKHKIK